MWYTVGRFQIWGGLFTVPIWRTFQSNLDLHSLIGWYPNYCLTHTLSHICCMSFHISVQLLSLRRFLGPWGWLAHSASKAANCTAELFSSHTINTFGNLGFDVLGIKKRIIKTLAVEYQLLLTLLSWEHYCPFKIVKLYKMGSTVTHVWTHLDMPCAFREHTIRTIGCSRIPLI